MILQRFQQQHRFLTVAARSLSSSSTSSFSSLSAVSQQRGFASLSTRSFASAADSKNTWVGFNTVRGMAMATPATAKTRNPEDSHDRQQQQQQQPPPVVVDVEDLHMNAVYSGQTTYTDPSTGFTVFTELAHLQRGFCCGNQCRHCPYGWVNVRQKKKTTSSTTKSPLGQQLVPKVPSGDKTAIQNLIRSYQMIQQQMQQQQQQMQIQQQSFSSTAPAQPPPSSSSTTTMDNKRTGGRRGGRYTKKNVPYTRGGDAGTSQLLNGQRTTKTHPVFEAMGTIDELSSVTGLIYAQFEQDIQSNRLSTAAASADDESNNVASIREEASLAVSDQDFREWLLDVMSILLDIGSHVGRPTKHSHRKKHDDDDASSVSSGGGGDNLGGDCGGTLFGEDVQQLEDAIDVMTNVLPELNSFVLPTGSVLASQFHMARTICRRAERAVWLIPQRPPSSSLDNADDDDDDDDDSDDDSKKKMIYVDVDSSALAYLNRLSDFYFVAARWINYRQGQPEIQYRRPNRSLRQRQRMTVSLDDSGGDKQGENQKAEKRL